MVCTRHRLPIQTALLKAQAVGMLIAWVTTNTKVNEKSNSIQKETSKTQFYFSENQYSSESRSIYDF